MTPPIVGANGYSPLQMALQQEICVSPEHFEAHPVSSNRTDQCSIDIFIVLALVPEKTLSPAKILWKLNHFFSISMLLYQNQRLSRRYSDKTNLLVKPNAY